ncbi:TIGR04282 family arsenosugar biosynthesis glycosyltransferase [Microbulbifer sp. OS29]|uniref:TIGR04282 family arsenosugar biosynthesis glycosyltransferase n=1 Tax=Microbulbifer okhotskensis TaxID=2926617 RepID=A0A9X2ERH6_9GAMM|nr:TIGR04282 family arsenosugar biosynthesis glycosyltransferase [Microbulbifer okhotskensis]MCO1334371.1 TIGR04282 family arsenosugar biosynthesis glycosyltransferase [Microbulbifer okhotskensis]
MNTDLRLIVLAKAPLPGYAKTRLIPALGESGAAELAERLLLQTLTACIEAELGAVELHVAPAPSHSYWQNFSLPEGVTLHGQVDGDLGRRLWRATDIAREAGSRVLLLGTDCPGLTSARLRTAVAELRRWDVVMYPALDGGYTLLGLSCIKRRLFEDIHWSTSEVAAQTLERMSECGLECLELEALADIDEPEDLRHLPDSLRENR